LPGQGDDHFKPLNWLTDKTEGDRCLPVDGTQERFDEFARDFADPASWIGKGHVVLITGDKGFGKTSLMLRCAAWLRDQAKDGNSYRLIMVNLSDERWAGSTSSEDRMRRTLGRMLDGLGLLVSSADRARISNGATTEDAFYELATLLATCQDDNGLPVIVAVLLEGYPILAELNRYYNVAQKGMFFFAEMFTPADISEISDDERNFNRNSADLYMLHLGPVKPEDLQTFADWIQGTGNNWPEFSDAVLEEIGNSVILQKISVLDLAKMMWGAIHRAQQHGARQVAPIHFTEYYALALSNTRRS
jgi:hypothetical protein